MAAEVWPRQVADSQVSTRSDEGPGEGVDWHFQVPSSQRDSLARTYAWSGEQKGMDGQAR